MLPKGFSDSALSVTGTVNFIQVKTSGIVFLASLTYCRYGQLNSWGMEWSKASMEYRNYQEAGEEKKKKKHQGQDSSIAVLTMRRDYNANLLLWLHSCNLNNLKGCYWVPALLMSEGQAERRKGAYTLKKKRRWSSVIYV